MQVYTRLLILSLFILNGCGATSPSTSSSSSSSSNEPIAVGQSVDELIADIENKHPISYLLLAANLFNTGDKDQAVQWYYIGQMRFRAYLMANPDLDPSADGALYTSFQSVLGAPINEYAGADPDAWVTLIDNAITWHKHHPNGFTPKEQYPDIYAEIEAGFISFKEQVASSKEAIRKQRALNGLPNRP